MIRKACHLNGFPLAIGTFGKSNAQDISSFNSISRSLFHGMEQYLGEWYPALISLSNAAILFAILYIMYRKRIFLRV